MALVTDNPELKEAFQKLVELTGKPEETCVYDAIQKTIESFPGQPQRPINWAAIRAIQDRVAKMPILDSRSEDEILGYNEHGLFD